MSTYDTKAKQVAMHEAAHILHAARMGAKKVVIHGAQHRHGRGFHAQTEPVYEEPPLQIVDSARYWAAGGVAERVLASAPAGDDPVDFEDFVTRAIVAGVAPKLVQEFWNAARQDMESYFALPEVQPHMQELAARVEAKIKEANESPQRKVQCTISELAEMPILLRLLDRHAKPA
jgi:hypothetical protein